MTGRNPKGSIWVLPVPTGLAKCPMLSVRVVLVAAIIVLVLIYVVTVAGWEVVALAE